MFVNDVIKLKAILGEYRIQATKARLTVLDILLNEYRIDAFSCRELYNPVGERMCLASVYNVIKSFEDCGLVEQVATLSKELEYKLTYECEADNKTGEVCKFIC